MRLTLTIAAQTPDLRKTWVGRGWGTEDQDRTAAPSQERAELEEGVANAPGPTVTVWCSDLLDPRSMLFDHRLQVVGGEGDRI